jgi:hypothetical protein
MVLERWRGKRSPPGNDDARAARALREGLREFPVPEAGPDFDTRVLARLAEPLPERERFRWRAWRLVRPVLAGAGCSLAATLLLYSWYSQLPLEERSVAAAPARDSFAADRSLEQDDLSTASLGRLPSFSRRTPARPERSPGPTAPAPRRGSRRGGGPRAA